MSVSLQDVEALATDQASLKAAAALAKPAKWAGFGATADGNLIWGECAGSASSPYRVVSDLRDLGNKCSCPSRKFPCKHVLALLWIRAEASATFPVGDAPEWVGDWLGRRRGSSNRATVAEGKPASDLASARLSVEEEPVDAATLARRAAAAERRSQQTAASIADGLISLEQWIADQLRSGLVDFVDDAIGRCRRIASRLVDAKAAGLASRVDEIPGRLLALPRGDRVRAAVVELGKLVLLVRAYRADPDDPGLRRAIATAETREAVLSDAATLRVAGAWDVVAETVHTRRDGLVAQTSWLLNLEEAGPRFAMLQDFFPASAGRRGTAFTPGTQFEAEVAFYPGTWPLRGLIAERGEPLTEERAWPQPAGSLAQNVGQALLAEPWLSEVPVLLGAGRLARDSSGASWWSAAGEDLVPIRVELEGLWRGATLERTAGLWSAGRLTPLAAQTDWGRVVAS